MGKIYDATADKDSTQVAERTWNVSFRGFLSTFFSIRKVERIRGPGTLSLISGKELILSAKDNPPGSGWLALLATIGTMIVGSALAKLFGCVIAPGWLIWYLIIRSVRRRDVDLCLNDAQRLELNPKNGWMRFLLLVGYKPTWVSFQIKEDFEEIANILRETSGSRYEEKAIWI